MEIGSPKRIYTVEPLDDPVPRETDPYEDPVEAPAEAEPVTAVSVPR